MIRLLFILCLFFNAIKQESIAQTFYAVHVQGKIYSTTHRHYIHTGDEINAKDSLIFSSPNHWAVLASEKGNVFLQNPSQKDSVSSCQQAIQPIESSTKVTSISNKPSSIGNLQAYFEGEQFVFIGNDFQLNLDAEFYPLSDTLFLIYRYEYYERHITIKIPYTKQTLSFNPVHLYTYKGEKIPYGKTNNTGIYLFNAVDNMPYTAAKFNPIWLSDQLVKEELQVLQKVYALQGRKKLNEIKTDLLQYILDVYGKTDAAYFYTWVDKHLE